MENKIYCMGVECSVKNACTRYTKGVKNAKQDNYMRKCSNQRKFLQDSEVVRGV